MNEAMQNSRSQKDRKPAAKCSFRAGQSNISVFTADSFYSRLRGLHAFLPLATDEALMITPCNSIHTLSMAFDIDVLFLGSTNVVIWAGTVPRFRVKRCANATAVLEMNSGAVEKYGIHRGDVLELETIE